MPILWILYVYMYIFLSVPSVNKVFIIIIIIIIICYPFMVRVDARQSRSPHWKNGIFIVALDP